MSSTATRNRPPVPRVATGMPWWIWAAVILFAAVLVFSIIRSLIPEDPAQLFGEAKAAIVSLEPEIVQQRIEQLRAFPDYSGHVQFLEAVLFLGRSMPLKAIPLLKLAAETPELRGEATLYLGRAYGRSGKLSESIATLKTVVDDPQAGETARVTLAGMLSSVQAYDEALELLNLQLEKKPDDARSLYLRAEIMMDTHRYEEAAVDLAASIAADKTDPALSQKSVKFLQARSFIGDFSDTGDIEENLDNPVSVNHFKALRRLSEGKLEDALAALEEAVMQAADTPMLSGVYGRIIAAYDKPELALDALPRIYTACITSPRDAELMRTLATLALQAGQTEIAAKATENADELEKIRIRMFEKLKEVAPAYGDVTGRMELADLALECGEADFSDRIFQGLVMFFSEHEAEIRTRRASFETRRLPIVNIPPPPGFSVSDIPMTSEPPPQLTKPTLNEGLPTESPRD